ncbi:hypothetical protein WICMUC_002450 [Wickerhamomyces mucosus]|uniref:Altered inheritance of mitochondria protein 36, mitochondrial n=1 Tax=Wickerhamomyces mucosus TaxID=1378264 RepID=A0A9P8PQK9_9ASCO|nr:hypothetical protein WICMUC_002450 [Wickerhamomyces mucosus]
MIRQHTVLLNCSRRLLARRALSTTSARLNQQKQSDKKSESSVNFKNFIAVGIISSIILTQVVEAVNKESPNRSSRSISEAEYARQQQRLKRRVALFSDQDNLSVRFLWSDKDIGDLYLPGFEIIDSLKLIEEEKGNKDSKYYDLLNDPSFQIPRGLINELVKKKLIEAKQDENGPKKFIIILDKNTNYDMKDFIQFEDRVITIDNFIILNSEKLHDAQRYYQTVKKVLKVDSVDELKDQL